MKIPAILGGIAAAFVLVTTAPAVTIDITGSTSFRTAAVSTIFAAYGGGLTDVAHNGAAGGYASATQSIFQGTFPGITGTTIIRCTWTGSVEGIRDLANTQTQNFLTTAAFSQGTSVVTAFGHEHYGVPTGTNPAVPKFAFSDVFPTVAPYTVSGITDTRVAVVTYVPMVNESAPSGLVNVNWQRLNELWYGGLLSLDFMFATSDVRNVFPTGRNDLSGTRAQGLAESLVGISTPVQQWKPTVVSGAVTTLQFWPTNDGANASSVWNGDIAGNGGFSSGGSVATALGATSNGVNLLDSDGMNLGTDDVLLISVLGTADAVTAVANGGKVLAYDGDSITPANPLSAIDRHKVTHGIYTLWGYEHLLYAGSLSGDETTLRSAILANVGTNLGATGVDLNTMLVTRSFDGAIPWR